MPTQDTGGEGLGSRGVGFLARFKELVGRLRPYRREVFLGVLSLQLVNAIEIFLPQLLSRVIDDLVQGATSRRLLFWGGIYFAITIVQSVFRYLWRVWLLQSSIFAGTDLRFQFVEALGRLRYSFFEKRSSGDLMSLAVSDAEAVRLALGPGILMAADVSFYFLLVPIALWRISPIWTLCSLAPLSVLPFFVIWHQRRIETLYSKNQQQFADLNGAANELVGNLPVTRAFAVEAVQERRLDRVAHTYLQSSLKLTSFQVLLSPVLDLGLSVGMTVLLVLASQDFLSASPLPGLTLGAFVAFQRYLQKLIWPITAVGFVLNMIQRALTSSDRLSSVLHSTETEAPPRTRNFAFSNPHAPVLEIRNLTFFYPGVPTRKILSKASLRIERGERVAILGAIGSGKTTLLGLLARLYDPAPGNILVCGRDVLDWDLPELRSVFAFAPQDAFVFAPDVQKNLRLGSQSRDRHRDTCDDALEYQQILDRTHLTGELDLTAAVHAGGRNLSGGQRQRVSLARGWATGAEIFVVDDALSAIDPYRERRILMELIEANRTLLYVTHRDTALEYMDRVYRLEGGELVEIKDLGGAQKRARARMEMDPGRTGGDRVRSVGDSVSTSRIGTFD